MPATIESSISRSTGNIWVRLVLPAGTVAVAVNLPSSRPMVNSTVTVSCFSMGCSSIGQHCSEAGKGLLKGFQAPYANLTYSIRRDPIQGARTQKGEMAKACGFPVDLTVYIAVRLKI